MKKHILLCSLLLTAFTQFSIAQNCTVSIAGNTCIGSQLTAVTDGNALSSVTWKLYNNTVYYADTVSSPASVSIVAGNYGTGSGAAQLSFPAGGIALDGAGNIYIANYHNDRIQKWTPGAASSITVAGGNGRGSAANQLSAPKDIFVDTDGNVYVANYAVKTDCCFHKRSNTKCLLKKTNPLFILHLSI